MKNNQMVLDNQTALREMYHSFVELISEFQETWAFEEIFDENQEYEHMLLLRKVNVSLQKARIDLKKIVYCNLTDLMDEIVNTTLDDLSNDENEDQEAEEVVELKAKEFYERLASIMAYYIYQN